MDTPQKTDAKHLHEWEHLLTEREGRVRARVWHGCLYCALMMRTTLTFDGGRCAGVAIDFPTEPPEIGVDTTTLP